VLIQTEIDMYCAHFVSRDGIYRTKEVISIVDCVGDTIYLISPEDEILRTKISNRLETLAKAIYRTLEGINVHVPPEHRAGLSMRHDQTVYHYEPRTHESVRTLWTLLEDLHKLFCDTHHIYNITVKKELQEDINILNVGVLRLLHLS